MEQKIAAPVAYLVSEKRDGRWMPCDWATELPTLAEAQERLIEYRNMMQDREFGLLAVSEVVL